MAPQEARQPADGAAPKRHQHKHKSSLLHDYLVQQQRQADAKLFGQQPVKIKPMLDHADRLGAEQPSPQRHQQHHQRAQLLADDSLASSSSIGQVQRKLLAFFYCYAILVVTMFLAYAIFCYHQQSVAAARLRHASADGAVQGVASSQVAAPADEPAEGARAAASSAPAESRLENKLLLLERYIEVIALDLEETKARLREREKCACSVDCTFNGTRFRDQQVWQQKCDICSCRAGRISCAPQKCPQLDCDDQTQLPGQCCPVCMKKCKLPNRTLVRHGHTFRPLDASGAQSKQCTCQNGLIKCEKIARPPLAQQNRRALQQQQPPLSTQLTSQQQASNRTVSEYLKLITTTAARRIAPSAEPA